MSQKSKLLFSLLILIFFIGWAVWGMSSYATSFITQVLAISIILGSLRVLVGIGGIISFGHALYIGMGAFGAAHAMLWAKQAGFTLPLILVPLAGGAAGFTVALFAGWLSTRRSHGIYSAMVTLALCELAHVLAQAWPAVFGGEMGLQIDRSWGNFAGIDFVKGENLLLLTLFYALLLIYGLHRFVSSPLGHWLQATREDAVRVACLGVYPKRVQYCSFLYSAFIAGIGGALLMLEFEVAEASMLSMLHSGSYLMFAYLGGLGSVFGSIIGATLHTFSNIGLPALTHATELYLGVIFIYATLKWPKGLLGAIQTGAKHKPWQKVMHHSLGFIALICFVELIYRIWSPFNQQTIVQGVVAHKFWLITLIISLMLELGIKIFYLRMATQGRDE